MTEFLTEYYQYFLIAHLFFVAIGLGAAVVTDVLFFKFLKDFQISKVEKFVMDSLSKVIWAAISGIVIAGLAVFATQAEAFLESPKFVAKMSIFIILILNGLALNFVVGPKLSNLFPGKKELSNESLSLKRKLSFAFGAVSMTSWISVFILGALWNLSLEYSQIMGIYATVVLMAIISSQLAEKIFANQLQK